MLTTTSAVRAELPPLEPDDPDCYLPTPEEIAAACLEISSGWTEKERRFRIRARPRLSVPIPEPVPRPKPKPFMPGTFMPNPDWFKPVRVKPPKVKKALTPKPKICGECGETFLGGNHAKRCKLCRKDFNRRYMRIRMQAKRKAVTA